MTVNSDLEERLLLDIEAKREIDSAQAFLLASGVQSEDEIKNYLERLSQIAKGFSDSLKTPWMNRTLDKAQTERRDYNQLINDNEALAGFLLFQHLYETKPERYNSEFLFHKVIDNQLSSSSRQVGNCLGLSCLFHEVGNLVGVNTVPIIGEHQGQTHVYLIQKTKKGVIPVETTIPEGFNYSSPVKGEEKSIALLLNEIYNSRFKRCEDEEEKERLADNVLRINPNELYFLIGKGSRLLAKDRLDEAKGYLDRAIMVDPNDVALLAYAKYLQLSGNADEARRYARIAKKLNPNPDDDVRRVIDSFEELDKK